MDDNTCIGARPTDQALSATPTEPQSVSALPGYDPSRITEYLRLVSGSALEPIIKDAADRFYEAALASAEDYLRDNLDWNLSSHITMLERENQRMRTELYEVDRAIGGVPLGHASRLECIGRLDYAAQQHAQLLYEVVIKIEGETRHQTARRFLRERNSDQSGEAGKTEGLDPQGASAGRDSGIAHTSAPSSESHS